jgi:hypothetical protein
VPAPDPDLLLVEVEAHLLGAFGHDSGRAGVSFLGAERIDVLRFGPDDDDLVRYATLGLSRAPMGDPGEMVVLDDGPRAELVLSVRGLHDSVLRRLTALAASPAVEGLVIGPGASLDVGEPLWDGARFSAVLVGEPGGLPLLPMTSNEAAFKRVHGAAALEESWLRSGADLRDPARPESALERPTG